MVTFDSILLPYKFTVAATYLPKQGIKHTLKNSEKISDIFSKIQSKNSQNDNLMLKLDDYHPI